MLVKTVLGAAAVAALLVGCSDTDDTASPPTDPPTTVGSGSPSTSATDGTTPSDQPTVEPSTVDAPCPYIDSDTIENTIGQRLSRTTVTSTVPNPGCDFYRADGTPAGSIRVTQYSTVPEAQRAALDTVGEDIANPADGIGDYGVVGVVENGAVLAATAGNKLLVVRINQQESIEVKSIASEVITQL